MPRTAYEPVSLFWSKVDKTETCWLWRGGISHSGYGVFHINRKTRSAHRVSWEFQIGSIPRGLHVCHTCDVKTCVRPDHLFLGTCKDNVDDKIAKGRGAYGEQIGRAFLTDELVRDIIVAFWKSGLQYKQFAPLVGLKMEHLWDIVTGRSWKHIDRLKLREIANNE